MPLIPATFTTRSMNSIYPQLRMTLHMRLLYWSLLPTLIRRVLDLLREIFERFEGRED